MDSKYSPIVSRSRNDPKIKPVDHEPVTDVQMHEVVHDTTQKNVTRYKKHRGEAAKICKDYGNDLASVLKLRFVDDLTFAMISRATGLSEHMIKAMCAPFAVIMDDPARVKQFKANEPHLLDGVRMLMVQGMVDQLTDEKRRKTMDLSRLTYGYGVLFDKARLERGESTANVMTLSDLVRAAHAEEVTEAEVITEPA